MKQLVRRVQRWLGRETTGEGAPTENAESRSRSGSASEVSDVPEPTPDGGLEPESSAVPDPGDDPSSPPSKSEVLLETGMTPEEFIKRGLETGGGRLRQQEVVEYTGWSESTVSRTLAMMEDDGEICRIQLGREKIVCLPHAVPPQTTVATEEEVG